MDQQEIHHLRNSEDPYFKEFWELYSSAFPLTERRNSDQQIRSFRHPAYQVNHYRAENHFSGFIAFWSSQHFVFIEHFAIAYEVRGNGFGSAILKSFIENIEVPVILEIEIPVDELTHRRLNFYETAGFIKNNLHHVQPPYHSGDQPLPLTLLSYPHQLDGLLYKEFARFQKGIVMQM